MLYFDPKSDSNHKGLPLDSKSNISAIYFGLNCSDDNTKMIRKILKDQNVDFFKMEKDPRNIYKLVERIIIN